MARRATPMPAAIRAPIPSCTVDPVRAPARSGAARSGAASARRAATANQAPAAKNTTHKARHTVPTRPVGWAKAKADRVVVEAAVPVAVVLAAAGGAPL